MAPISDDDAALRAVDRGAIDRLGLSADSITPTRGGAVALVLIAIGAPVGITLGIPELWVPAAFAAIATLISWASWTVMRQPISICHDVPDRGMSGRPLATAVSASAPGAKRPLIVSIDAGPAGTQPEPVFTEVSGRQPSAAMRVEFPAPSRGLAPWRDIQAVQPSPFGFTQRRLTFAAPRPTVIWPRMVVLDLGGGRSPALEGVTNRRLSQTSGAELSALLRDYRDGDDLRHVHWPSSARVGSLMVRQVDESHERIVSIHVEVVGARLDELAAINDELDREPSALPLDRLSETAQEVYDRACSVTCSVAMAALTAGLEVDVTTGGGLHLFSSDYSTDPFGLIDTLAQTLPIDLTAPRSGASAADRPPVGRSPVDRAPSTRPGGTGDADRGSAASSDSWRSIPDPRRLRIDVIGSISAARPDGAAGRQARGTRSGEAESRWSSGSGAPSANAHYTIDVSATDPSAPPPDRFTIVCPRLDLLAERWSRWNLHLAGGAVE